MTEVYFDFNTILDLVVDTFFTLYATAILVWEWLSSPIDAGFAEIFDFPLTTTNIELLFGPMMIIMLVTVAMGTLMRALFP